MNWNRLTHDSHIRGKHFKSLRKFRTYLLFIHENLKGQLLSVTSYLGGFRMDRTVCRVVQTKTKVKWQVYPAPLAYAMDTERGTVFEVDIIPT